MVPKIVWMLRLRPEDMAHVINSQHLWDDTKSSIIVGMFYHKSKALFSY